MSDAMNFDDPTLREVPVKIGDKRFVLREASGDAACKWRNSILKATKLVDGKPASMDGLADGEPYLVSLCLFELNADGLELRPVPLHVVRSWPARVQKALFERVKSMSDLDDAEDAGALEKTIADAQEKLSRIRSGEDKAKN